MFSRSEPTKKPVNKTIFTAVDSQKVLGSLRLLGTGRIICNHDPLSLVISTDFRSIDHEGRHLIFPGGVLELIPGNLQVLVSTASCGLGLGISVFDQRKKLQMVFHFCDGSPWGKWLESHVLDGLLQPHSEPQPTPLNLCWCELWPQPQAATFAMPGSLLENRLSIVTNSRTIEATLRSPNFELTAVTHPASFDILSSSVRFWDRPRTRVCYADLSSLEPQQHETYVALHA